MAYVGLNNIEHIVAKVKTIHKGMDIYIDNVLLKGKGEEGDYQLTIELDSGYIKTTRTFHELMKELESMGFEYIPRKRVYRR